MYSVEIQLETLREYLHANRSYLGTGMTMHSISFMHKRELSIKNDIIPQYGIIACNVKGYLLGKQNSVFYKPLKHYACISERCCSRLKNSVIKQKPKVVELTTKM